MTNPETSGVELPEMDLLRKFDVPAPRYTSYPTADRFHAGFGVEDYQRSRAARTKRNPPIFRSTCTFPSATTSAITAAATRS